MKEILAPLADLMSAILPGWLVLPSLTYVLPHPAYWYGLLFFPPLAIYLVKRAENKPKQRLSVPIAYLLWLWGGFGGLHRFYVRSLLPGLVYVVLFLLILMGNSLSTEDRNTKSTFDNELKISEFMVKRHQKSVDAGKDSAKPQLAKAIEKRDEIKLKADVAQANFDRWQSMGGGIFALIIILLLIDAILIPGLVKACAAREAHLEDPADFEVMERGAKVDARQQITNPAIQFIEKISGWSGNFVAYWSVLAVFVYYYEVIARYVFNSPTNWAHESMFLMFGMQYLLSGAYALREGAHVRVDVIYERFSTRARAIIDVFTSIVFFIFTATLAITGYLFARDAIDVMEVSFTEWAIQYWPVKITITLGAVLLLLQGVAKLMRDLTYLQRGEAA